jgi:chemotaxis protein histidine kinase CheA
VHVCAAARSSSGGGPGSSSNSSEFQARAAQFAEDAQQRVKDFVKEQQLEEKASAASKEAQKKLADMYEETQQNLRRTYMQLDSTYNIQENIGKTAKKVTETAQDIDQQFLVRRRLRNAADDLGRNLPRWRRQLGDFSSTSGGKAVLTLVFVSLLLTGALWHVINLLWLLWFASVPIGMIVADRTRKAAQEQQAAQQQQQSSSQRASAWGSSSSSRRGRGYDNGPVVEAEWTTVDEGDAPPRKR